jgi:hypothetical protein
MELLTMQLLMCMLCLKNWRLACLLSTAGMLLATAGLVWVASQKHFALCIVEPDSPHPARIIGPHRTGGR